MEEIIEAFSMDRVQKSPSVFDMTKLKWINGQHLRLMEDAELAGLLGPFLEKEGLAKVRSWLYPWGIVLMGMARTSLHM